ncbi:MAG: SLC13 family permease [Acidobacteriota bacterium]
MSHEHPIEGGRKKPTARRIGFWLGLVVFGLTLSAGSVAPDQPLVARMAAVALLMAIWWISDAVPLAATSLLPLVLYPLLGIMSGKEVAPVYVNYVIFLFLGGFLIALAMERWNLHKRIALSIIGLVGGSPALLVLGFMIATAFLSMWISNTATAIMMLAIGLAVIRAEEESFGEPAVANLSIALLLGIAYSASAGGLATLVGTPPNLSLVRIFELTFPRAADAGVSFSFGQWMLLALPLSVLLLTTIWLLITQVFFRSPPELHLSSNTVESERRKLGALTREQAVILGVFVATAVLWVFRNDLTLGASFRIPGWSNLLTNGDLLDDGTIAIAMALLLFLVPAKNRSPQAPSSGDHYGTILDFSVFGRVPWHIILLFGGGFALAKGFQTSGLSVWVAQGFSGLEGTPIPIMIAAICFTLTFLTELTSNTATTEMTLPLLASIAVAAKIHPLLLMVPAALSTSCAFMMPVATPPNAIVFGSGRLRIADMVKIGIVINLIGVALITLLFTLLGPAVFGIEAGVFPDWAKPE